MALHGHGKSNPSSSTSSRGKALRRVFLGKDLNPAGKERTVATQTTPAAIAARKRRRVRT